jgi:hypothetical protein
MKLIAIGAGVALAYRRLVKKAPEAGDAKETASGGQGEGDRNQDDEEM